MPETVGKPRQGATKRAKLNPKAPEKRAARLPRIAPLKQAELVSADGTLDSPINLRNGIAVKNRTATHKAARAYVRNVTYAYTDAENILNYITSFQPDEKNVYGDSVAKAKPQTTAPNALESELSEMQIQEIISVKSKDELQDLLAKYAPNNDDADGYPMAYLAAVIHNRDYLDQDRKDKADLFKLILSRNTERDKTDDRKSLSSIKRFGVQQQGNVEDNIKSVFDVLNKLEDDVNITNADYGDAGENLKLQNTHLAKMLNDKEEWRDYKALSDYANTLFAQYRDIMEEPWNVIERVDPLRKGTTKENNKQRLQILYAAQRALEALPAETFHVQGPLFRWLGGKQEHPIGGLLSALSLYSMSTGTLSSRNFANKTKEDDARTLYIINKSKTGMLIQLLTGTKNWYQREVLSPTYAQYVVKGKNEISEKEVWYVLDELDGDLSLVPDGQVPFIGFDKDSYNALPDDTITKTLVDAKHRRLFDGKKPTRQELEDADIQLADDADINTITAANVYGKATHDIWGKLLKEPVERRKLLTEETIKHYHGELMNSSDSTYRTEERGWGENRKLTSRELENLRGHDLLVYPTIDRDDLDEFKKWVRRRPKDIDTIKGEMSKEDYIKDLNEALKELVNDPELPRDQQRIPILESVLMQYIGLKKYNEDDQLYSVSYGATTRENVSHNLRFTLDEVGPALEQSLALYVGKYISQETYIESIQRGAARVQQAIAAVHPFEDGNGRLSRLMMYKILQAYLPTPARGAEANHLPIIEDPDKDLVMSKDEWYDYVFGSAKLNIASGSGLGQSDGTDKPGQDDSKGGPGSDDDKGGPDSGKGGGQDNNTTGPKPIRSLSAGDGPNQQLSVFRTRGGGNCAIHAMFGTYNQFANMVIAANHKDIRANLANEIRTNALNYKDVYKPQLRDLMAELYGGDSKKGLSDEKVWLLENISKIDDIDNDIKTASDLNNQKYAILHQQRQYTIDALRQEILGEVSTNNPVLSELLIESVVMSNAESDIPLRSYLLEVDSPEERLGRLYMQEDAVINKLILENIDLLVLQSGNSDTQSRYFGYQQQLSTLNHSFDPIIERHYQALMNAYSASVAADGFYLRDVDLQVLAHMANKQLKLYRRSDQEVRKYVVQTYGEGDGKPLEIYHQGVHYEQARSVT